MSRILTSFSMFLFLQYFYIVCYKENVIFSRRKDFALRRVVSPKNTMWHCEKSCYNITARGRKLNYSLMNQGMDCENPEILCQQGLLLLFALEMRSSLLFPSESIIDTLVPKDNMAKKLLPIGNSFQLCLPLE